MIALVPALDRAVPQHPADGVDKGQRAPFDLRGGAKPRQPVDVGLLAPQRPASSCPAGSDRGGETETECSRCLATRLESSTT